MKTRLVHVVHEQGGTFVWTGPLAKRRAERFLIQEARSGAAHLALTTVHAPLRTCVA